MSRFEDTPNVIQQDQGFRSDEVRGPYREEWAEQKQEKKSTEADSIGGGSQIGDNTNPAWSGAQASLESDVAGRGMYGNGAEGALGYGEYDAPGGEMPSSASESDASKAAGPSAETAPTSKASSSASTPNKEAAPAPEAYGTRHWGHGEFKGDDKTGDASPRESAAQMIERAVEKVGQFLGVGPKNYRRSDGRVHEDVCECLANHHEINAAEIEVEVTNGVVKLGGTVDDRGMRRVTEDVVTKVSGVREVENHLGVSNYVARTEDADKLKSGEAPTLHS